MSRIIRAGDRDLFEIQFSFEEDPDRGAAATPSYSASWGALEMHVAGVNLCRHVAGSEVHAQVRWYLLPVIRWFLVNWDAMLHEIRLPFRQADSARSGYYANCPVELPEDEAETVFDWWQRHALRSAAEGGLMPDLFVRRSGNQVECSWGHAPIAGAEDARFLAAGRTVLLRPEEVAEPLYSALGQALEYLRFSDGDAEVASLMRQHQQLKTPSTLDRAAWIARLGPTIESSRDVLARLARDFRGMDAPSTSSSIVIGAAPRAVLMFGSLSPTVTEEDARTVLTVIQEQRCETPVQIPSVDENIGHGQPWIQGYELARRTSTRLPSCEPPIDIEANLKNWGVHLREIALSDREVRAIALCGDDIRPTILVNEKCDNNLTAPGRRFTLAHELCHLLFDREDGVELAVASGPWAPPAIEKRANAFASMLLMPEERVRILADALMRAGRTKVEIVQAIAAEFHTSKTAASRHLENLGIMGSYEREMIAEQLAG